MSRRLRLEINGQNVRNPFLRTVGGVVILILVAALLLILGILLLPIFIAILAIALAAGAVGIHRFRKSLHQIRQSPPSAPNSTDLDPSMEVGRRPPTPRRPERPADRSGDQTMP